MKILAIEASARVCGCSILEDGVIKASMFMNDELKHSKTLLPIIDKVINLAKINPKLLDYIALTNGPGSFTGLRIAMATAKGLSRGYGAEIIGISTLESLAHNIYTDKYIFPIMDARRNQVYSAVYKFKESKLIEIEKPETRSIDEVVEIANKLGETVFLGDGIITYEDTLKNKVVNLDIAPKHLIYQNPNSTAFIAYKKIIETQEYLNEIVYLRKPQAERERENG